jgi:hypothetical protein
MHHDKEREIKQLEEDIAKLEEMIKLNIEQHALLHKEKAKIKRELWEMRG